MFRIGGALLVAAFLLMFTIFGCTISNKPDQPFFAVHDTINAPIPCDTTMMADSLRGKPYIEPGWDKGYANSMQYRIWLQRNKKMKRWVSQYSFIHLPPNAHIIDEQSFSTLHGTRVLVAWMTDLSVGIYYNDAAEEEKEMWWYKAKGSGYFEGDLHFTLVDPQARKEINTVHYVNYFVGVMFGTGHYVYDEILTTYPFAGEGILYHTKGGSDKHDGEADIMHLFDANGDGRKHEFLLYKKEVMGDRYLDAALFGYNERKDSFFAYQWTLTTYQDIGNPAADVFTGIEYGYPEDFSYIKKYGSGRLAKSVIQQNWVSAGDVAKLDSTGEAKIEFFDVTQYGEPTDYVYEEARYDAVRDEYSIMQVRLPLYYHLRILIDNDATGVY